MNLKEALESGIERLKKLRECRMSGKLYEMKDTVVEITSQDEWDEYNQMRIDVGWKRMCYSWREMSEWRA